ncbi:MAG: hypothetical protein KDD41_03945 [Flavobacteriales bacterium]|nr:hypothetical protein [Flavobacteriales bacterium]
MLNFLDKYPVIRGKECLGVEIIFTSKEHFTVIAVELVSEKDGITIQRKWADITLEELAKLNAKKLPVYVSVTGRGIIFKKVKHTLPGDQELLNQVLPNASVKDFHLQQSSMSGSEGWVAVARKDLVEELLDQMEQAGFFVLHVYLGPFILENIIGLIGKDSLHTLSHELLFYDNLISHIDSLGDVSGSHEYEIDGELINSYELVAFATAFSHFLMPPGLIPMESGQVNQFREEYLHKKKASVVGLSIAVLFLLLTVGNLLVKNNIEASYNEYQYQVLSKKELVEELGKLREEMAVKEAFIQNSGVVRASRISYYADQVALSIPDAIRLDELFINPTEKRINKAEDIAFLYNKIKVTGTVTRSIDLNEWIKHLKNHNWSGDVTIISFNQENLSTPGEFEIEIEIVT